MARRLPKLDVALTCSSAFSFLRAASEPEDLVHRAKALDIRAVGLEDLGGVYGVPRFVKAAKEAGIKPVLGAVVLVSFEYHGRAFIAPITLLCEDAKGWGNLCELLTLAHAGQEKGSHLTDLESLDRYHSGLIALIGGPHGPIAKALLAIGPEAATAIASRVRGIFGACNVYAQVERRLDPGEDALEEKVIQVARSLRIPLVASRRVLYHSRERGRVLDVLTAIRRGTQLDRAADHLPSNHEAYLLPPSVAASLFADMPEAITNAVELADKVTFALESTGYRFPDFPVPEGETRFSLLYQLVHQGIRERYRPVTPRVLQQVAHELSLIEKLDLSGYFLLVHDIVQFCRRHGILAQGRGSAANSVVCYALGITAVDPIGYDLLFERFLSEERGEWPDIDLDLPSGEEREKVIQYVYKRYGSRCVGMTATVITYKARNAVRDAGKVFGLEGPALDRLARLIRPFEFKEDEEPLEEKARIAGFDIHDHRVEAFLWTCEHMQGLPRHLSQHNGGLVIAAQDLCRVVPLEPARMPGRQVVQWDKDDLADIGIIKVDLLGLGMLAAIRDAIQMVEQHEGKRIDLAHLPKDDPRVYQMLQRADTVGVFQVESRAQMAILPRMKPERFYDIVVEVAIVRPGPIVGHMVHPYLERRMGRQPVTYPHPSLEPILERTLGVPLFQEQVMRIAMVAGGFSGGQAEELRRAMGAKRSRERMEALMKKLREGMTRKGIPKKAQNEIVQSISSFAMYGFPESHAASFALIAYASAYLKAHHRAAFYAALLNNWPMGFYHPATLVRDAMRHGVEVLGIDVHKSQWDCTLERTKGGKEHNSLAVRLGFRYVKGLSRDTADAIVQLRPFENVEDLARRTGAKRDELMALARAGAFGARRRQALWECLGAEKRPAWPPRPQESSPEFPPMHPLELVATDLEATGLSAGPHPIGLVREQLERLAIQRIAEALTLRHGHRVTIAGTVIVRQRPGTAKGFYFATLEDETGTASIAASPATFKRYKTLLTTEPVLVVSGRLQHRDGVTSILVEQVSPIREPVATKSTQGSKRAGIGAVFADPPPPGPRAGQPSLGPS